MRWVPRLFVFMSLLSIPAWAQQPVTDASSYVNLLNTASATATVTSPAVRIPNFGSQGTLIITFASITGSPSNCRIQINNVDSLGNSYANGNNTLITVANGTTERILAPNYSTSLQTAAQINAVFTCNTYPSTGTISIDYAPAFPVAEYGLWAVTINNATPVSVALSPANDSVGVSSTITTRDTASTSTTEANGQVFVTGTPTTGSFYSFDAQPSVNGQDTLMIQVTGPWTGTLTVEESADAGTTWWATSVYQDPVGYVGTTFTNNFIGYVNIAALNYVRVRAVGSSWTGTATVLPSYASVNPRIMTVTSPSNGVYNTTPPAPTSGAITGMQQDQSANLLTALGIQFKAGAAWTSATSSGTFQYATGTATQGALSGAPSYLVQLDSTSTITGGVVTWQGTYDNVNWVTIPVSQVLNPQTFAQLTNPYTLTASANVPFLIISDYVSIRADLSTAITGTGAVTPYWATIFSPPVAPVTIANTVATQPAGFGSLVSAQQAVTASAVALPSNAVHGFCVKALPGNTITVYVGPSGVTTSTGYPLIAEDSVCYQLSNTNLVYVIASTTGASVAVTGN
jgi:hypothetical protein